jgi:hypothetical protein
MTTDVSAGSTKRVPNKLQVASAAELDFPKQIRPRPLDQVGS